MKAEIEKYVGKKGWVRLGGLKVEIEILDYKHSYGRERWLVTPIAGADEVWVELVMDIA